MSEVLKYAVIFEKPVDGYDAYVPDLPGCVTVGEALEETERKIREAIAGHLEVMREFGDPIREPTTIAENIEISAA
jgi:predicted RNase H-like HicB family nuclease